MGNKRTHQLTAQTTPSESLVLGIDDPGFTEEKNITVELLNKASRHGAGLNTNGEYHQETTANFIHSSDSIHQATMDLDTAIKQVETDASNMATQVKQVLDDRIQTISYALNQNDLVHELRNGITIVQKKPGYFIEVISAMASLIFNTTAYNSPSDVNLISADSSQPIMLIPNALVTGAEPLAFKAEWIPNGQIIINNDLQVKSNDYLNTGDSTIKIHVTYRYIPL
jgi:hypothetical protein